MGRRADVTIEAGPRRGARARTLATALVAAAGLVALAALASRVARVYPVSSDDATGVLEAVAVLQGNVLLRGWELSSASFAVIDLPFYVAGVALRGQRPSLLRDVPVAIYAAAVVAAAVLARGRRQGGRPWLGVAAVLVLLGLPAGGLAEFVTKGYIRVGTTLGLFAALLVLDVPPGRRASSARVAAFGVVLMLTILSDPYALYVGAPAYLAVCLLGALRVRSYDTVQVGPVALAVLGAAVASKGLTWLIEGVGGYRVLPNSLSESLAVREPVRGVIQSGVTLATYLPDLYRCGLLNELTGKSLVLWIGCLIGPALLLFAVVRGCPLPFRGRREGLARPADFVADVLWVSAALGVAAFLVSSTAKDRPTIRYMIPFMLLGSALTGRVLADHVQRPRSYVIGLVVLGLTYAVTVVDDLRKPPAADTAEALADWLDSNGLRHGYGPFWDASIVTASSRDGRVAVRPVWVRPVSATSHRIVPMVWMAEDHWFSEGPATFVVLEPGPMGRYQFGLDRRICIMSFGRPKAGYEVGPYLVMVWDHDLRPLLNRESREPAD
jgi:hypothetical protein